MNSDTFDLLTKEYQSKTNQQVSDKLIDCIASIFNAGSPTDTQCYFTSISSFTFFDWIGKEMGAKMGDIGNEIKSLFDYWVPVNNRGVIICLCSVENEQLVFWPNLTKKRLATISQVKGFEEPISWLRIPFNQLPKSVIFLMGIAFEKGILKKMGKMIDGMEIKINGIKFFKHFLYLLFSLHSKNVNQFQVILVHIYVQLTRTKLAHHLRIFPDSIKEDYCNWFNALLSSLSKECLFDPLTNIDINHWRDEIMSELKGLLACRYDCKVCNTIEKDF